jgi:hypothetical protein
MSMRLVADLRIVARDARLQCRFLKREMHPGGGPFVTLSRLIGRRRQRWPCSARRSPATRPLSSAWRGSRVDDTTERPALEPAGRMAADP